MVDTDWDISGDLVDMAGLVRGAQRARADSSEANKAYVAAGVVAAAATKHYEAAASAAYFGNAW